MEKNTAINKNTYQQGQLININKNSFSNGVKYSLKDNTNSDNTCERCKYGQSNEFTWDELEREGLIPPVHPNCNCTIVTIPINKSVFSSERNDITSDIINSVKDEVSAIVDTASNTANNPLAPNKTDKISEEIVDIYERAIYDKFKDYFDEYSIARKEYYGVNKDLMDEAEDRLSEKLIASGVDIKAITRDMMDNLMAVSPRDDNFFLQMRFFYNFADPYSPTDLKIQSLYDSIGADTSSYDFSLWAREWEDGMTTDYLGNYAFGYAGADYFDGFTFDEYVSTLQGILDIANLSVSIGELSPVSAAMIWVVVQWAGNELLGLAKEIEIAVTEPDKRDGVEQSNDNRAESIIYKLRTAHPDKTDAEILCLFGGGLAQLIYDISNNPFDVQKHKEDYLESLSLGYWGDNFHVEEDGVVKFDADYASDGFKDYYKYNK